MTEEQLRQQLNSGRLSKERIIGLVHTLLEHPQLTKTLWLEVLQQDKEGEFNASWVFDHLVRKRPTLVLPFVNDFIGNLKNLQSESCIRPMAHSCQLLTEAYFEKKNPEYLRAISNESLEELVTVCFDWFIGEHKVAAKVFAMTCLYHLGTRFDWIHPELLQILQDTIASGTAGYQSRGKKILAKLRETRS